MVRPSNVCVKRFTDMPLRICSRFRQNEKKGKKRFSYGNAGPSLAILMARGRWGHGCATSVNHTRIRRCISHTLGGLPSSIAPHNRFTERHAFVYLQSPPSKRKTGKKTFFLQKRRPIFGHFDGPWSVGTRLDTVVPPAPTIPVYDGVYHTPLGRSSKLDCSRTKRVPTLNNTS